MKVSGKKNRKAPVYGWMTNGTCFLSPSASHVERRPLNQYDSREEAETEAAARGREIVWEDVADG